MGSSFAAMYAFLAVVALAAALTVAYVMGTREDAGQRRIRLVLCQPETSGSPQRLLCTNVGAVDLYPDGHWQHAGPITALPGAPRG